MSPTRGQREETVTQSSPKIVHLVQPAVPHYRIPFMRDLNLRSDFDLAIWAPERTELHDSHKDLEEDGIRFLESPIKQLGPFCFQMNSIRAALTADVLILSLNIRFLDLVPAAVIARIRGSGIVFWGHGRSPRRATWSTRIRDRVANLGHVYVLYSNTEKNALKERQSYRGMAIVARNTIDTVAVQSTVRTDAAGTDRGIRIGFVSRLYDAKRVDLLIRAFYTASHQISRSSELVIVGDGPEREKLQALAKDLGIENRVRFCGPIHDEVELAAIMRTWSAFCMPEAAGLSAIHAMAYSLPVILNDDSRSNGPEYEILKPGINGLTFKRGDVADLARAITTILTDDDLRNRLAVGALKAINSEGYSVQSMTDSFYAAIDASWMSARKFRRRPS